MGNNRSAEQEILQHISAKPAVEPVLLALMKQFKTSSTNLGYIYQDRPGMMRRPLLKTSLPHSGNMPISGRLGQAGLQPTFSFSVIPSISESYHGNQRLAVFPSAVGFPGTCVYHDI